MLGNTRTSPEQFGIALLSQGHKPGKVSAGRDLCFVRPSDTYKRYLKCSWVPVSLQTWKSSLFAGVCLLFPAVSVIWKNIFSNASQALGQAPFRFFIAEHLCYKFIYLQRNQLVWFGTNRNIAQRSLHLIMYKTSAKSNNIELSFLKIEIQFQMWSSSKNSLYNKLFHLIECVLFASQSNGLLCFIV